MYYFLAFESGNLTATVESLVDCIKRRDNLFEGVSQRRLTSKRQGLCSQVSLCRLQQREGNVHVDELACAGYVSEKKMSIWTGWPV